MIKNWIVFLCGFLLSSVAFAAEKLPAPVVGEVRHDVVWKCKDRADAEVWISTADLKNSGKSVDVFYNEVVRLYANRHCYFGTATFKIEKILMTTTGPLPGKKGWADTAKFYLFEVIEGHQKYYIATW